MFISFVWGVFVRGVFGKGDFCPGGFCPGVYVRGGFVLIPFPEEGGPVQPREWRNSDTIMN